MSNLRTREWLLRSNQFTAPEDNLRVDPFPKKRKQRATTVSFVSGKGGVGKTSLALKLGKKLSAEGYKTLVIDCDYNLSNTAVKLGLRSNDYFYDYVKGIKSFDECIYKDGLFHLFTGCNGNLSLDDKDLSFETIILDTMSCCEELYDYIFLDCPAGISRDVLTFGAYTKKRIVVINPDVSSITDSYSLMKLLNNKYGVDEFSLLVNKVSNSKKCKKITTAMIDTVDRFLNCRLGVVGKVSLKDVAVDQFDRHFLQGENITPEDEIDKIIKRLTEKEMDIGNLFFDGEDLPIVQRQVDEQEVQVTI